ncbi:hypothetical protein BDW02DRAFT_583928 [Decorospora gaudefroyi]|uniref:Uncharacterized protein n=1 Tax=Decorospora gaudefroyi TaxID=184978 RepID=A0A6A5K3U9_9PLEO|nr:hypothetical protein BDW02DRAFT_583928 [Decorospora gaudefroyi]
MAPKRKQLHAESSRDASVDNPVKKAKIDQQQPESAVYASSRLKRKRADNDDNAIDATPAAPAKRPKLKLILKPQPTLSDEPAPAPTKTTAPAKARATKSTLVPRGARETAQVGQRNEAMLRMVCDCTTTGRVTELHFRKISQSAIDWDNAYHISKINAWRNQIYGRAGIKARAVNMWHEYEELWFELYFQLSIAESRTRGIMLPATKAVRDAFNEMFAGKVLKDKDGVDLEARSERQGNAFASKFNRVCPVLRARLNACVFGRSGDVFVPTITFNMLDTYKGMKAEMVAKGITEESVMSDNLEEWKRFLSGLTDLEEEELKAKEADAVVALLSLRYGAIVAQEMVLAQATTPELIRSARNSLSSAEADLPTPPVAAPKRAKYAHAVYFVPAGADPDDPDNWVG